MTKNESAMQAQLRSLQEERAKIDRKIKALELYFDEPAPKQDSSNSDVRHAPDLRPVITKIFDENGNKPIQLKQLMKEIQEHTNMPLDTIKRKMYHLKQTFLESAREEVYGAWRMPKP